MNLKKKNKTFRLESEYASQILTIVLASSLIYYLVKNPERLNIFTDIINAVHNFLN